MNKILIFTKPFPPFISINKRYPIVETLGYNFRIISDIGTNEGISISSVINECEWGYILKEPKLSNNIKIL